ncbi:MAG: DUF2279 domain-containing protein [Bacteroidota bacterium]
MKKILFSFILIIAFTNSSYARNKLSFFEKSPVPDTCRIRLLNYSTAALYPLSMTWLYTQWYRDYPQSSFHFFNDNSEWMQMDKYAHFFDAYSIAKPLTHMYQWAGYDNKRSTLYGCGIAFLFQTTVEVFDGFSSEWGFSAGDLACNTGGVLLFGAQQLGWKEQRIILKYSFHQSQFARYRPDVLGSSLPENILKDYNGLTSWVCINPSSFMNESTKFPKWLNVAVGFGAEGMTGGDFNPAEVNGKIIPKFERYRQYYLAFDIELSRIKTRSAFLSGVFKFVNILHLPLPALEFSPGRKTVGRLAYF